MADLEPDSKPGNDRDARAAARLLAVQALYQMDIAKTPLENIIKEFVSHRLDVSMDGVDLECRARSCVCVFLYGYS